MRISNDLPKEYIEDEHNLFSGASNRDYSIKVGTVRELVYSSEKNQTKYIVETIDRGRLVPITCTILVKFGGLYNYEEFNLRGFDPGSSNVSYGNLKCVAGDTVLVACINGQILEGVIIGALSHLGRKEILPADGSISYIKEFNGIQEVINSSGEYRVTFKGIPTNISALNSPPSENSLYPEPEYNYEIGSSFYQFDKNGSYFLTDNSTTGPQYLMLDKEQNKIFIGSGKTLLTIDKVEESYTIDNKLTTFNSEEEFNVNTKKTAFKSSEEWSLETKKTLVKSSELIDAEAKDIKTKGNWSQEGDMAIKGNISQKGDTEIQGKLTTSGETLLAGGKYPLIYEITRIQGTGNLGSPVISQAIVKLTKKTKAS